MKSCLYFIFHCRLHKVPVMSKKDMEKKLIDRGHTDVLYKKDQVLVAWKDSKAVYVASNKYSADTKISCKRFDRIKRTSVQVCNKHYCLGYFSFHSSLNFFVLYSKYD